MTATIVIAYKGTGEPNKGREVELRHSQSEKHPNGLFLRRMKVGETHEFQVHEGDPVDFLFSETDGLSEPEPTKEPEPVTGGEAVG